VGEEANLVLVDLAATWEVGRGRLREPLRALLLRGRELRGRVLLTLAAGGVAYRERTFAVTAA
jgi:dihydroorotase